MTKTRATWQDIRPTLVFPRTHWKQVTVIRVQRRTTKQSRAAATFEERYTLQCDCGRKWVVESKDFNRSNVKDCGKDCRLYALGMKPEEILMGRYGVFDRAEAHKIAMAVWRAAKAHGWKY